jgi:uncharacterized protein
VSSRDNEARFLDVVLADPTVAAVLERAPVLGVEDCGRTPCPPPLASSRRDPAGGQRRDADFSYFDPDTSWDAEDAVIRRGAELFGDLPVPVEIRNEARVHLRYADRFGTPSRPLRDCADAIDGFAAVCCCYGVTVDRDGQPRVHAPYGYDDLFGLIVRPNRHSPAPGTFTKARHIGGQVSGPSSPCCPGTTAPWSTDRPGIPRVRGRRVSRHAEPHDPGGRAARCRVFGGAVRLR